MRVYMFKLCICFILLSTIVTSQIKEIGFNYSTINTYGIEGRYSNIYGAFGTDIINSKDDSISISHAVIGVSFDILKNKMFSFTPFIGAMFYNEKDTASDKLFGINLSIVLINNIKFSSSLANEYITFGILYTNKKYKKFKTKKRMWGERNSKKY